MEKTKNKTYTTIILILILALSSLITIIPITLAHDPPLNIPTFAYVSVAPSIIGVNQEVLVFFWLHIQPPTAAGAYGDRWHNMKVEVTTPDGSTDTLGPYDSDPIGFAWAPYTPTQVGTYTFQFSFPGQTLTGENLDPNDMTGRAYIGDYFEPSTSDTVELTVQADQIEAYPETAIPDEYWSRPIDAQHRNWWSISGNWLNAPGRNWVPPNGFVPYTQSPKTAHILWTKELTFGGLVGGEFESNAFHCGNAYEGKWMPPVIIAGKLFYNENPDNIYYNRPNTFPMEGPKPGVYCADLRTGEEIWYTDEFRLDFGQVYMYDSPNQHGALAYLWEVKGSTWNCFDAFTKDWVYTIENVPGGTQMNGPDGSVYKYQLNTQGDWLTLWSSTAMPELAGGPSGTNAWQWRPNGKTVDGADGYLWNVTIPSNLEGRIGAIFPGDRIIGYSNLGRSGWLYLGTEDYSVWCLSLKPGEEGQLLWKKDYSGDGVSTLEFSSASVQDGVFTLWNAQTLQHWGFDIDTGNAIWGPTEAEASWQMTVGSRRGIAYGKLFSVGYAGIVYCYNAMTGEIDWTYKVECPYYLESMWGSNYIIDEFLVADGKFFAFCGEHSPNDPKERGNPTVCLDVNTGEELWKTPFYCSHWSRNPAIADGILVFLNTYDNRIYAFGKGPTALTVEKPQAVAELGSALTIQGTIMDVSPGTKDVTMQMRFPNGVPAIADVDQDDWNAYLHMQFEKPEDLNGVPVKIEAITPSGGYENLGTATSDAYGNWAFGLCPEEAGTYMIIATFEGSDAYYGSTQTSYLTVADPVSTVDFTSLEEGQSSLQEGQSNMMTYILVILVIVIIALLIAVYSLMKSQK